jgi:hypothetical protein
MSMDAKKLKEALDKLHQPANSMSLGAVCVSHDALKTVLAAAESHLATLPRTKEVEVWRIEYAAKDGDEWLTCCKTYKRRDLAYRAFQDHLCARYQCVKVTGPHKQEIPA